MKQKGKNVPSAVAIKVFIKLPRSFNEGYCEAVQFRSVHLIPHSSTITCVGTLGVMITFYARSKGNVAEYGIAIGFSGT